MREMSSTSSTIAAIWRPQERIVVRYSRTDGEGVAARASSAMPMMPFIGVRNSWLTVATNRLRAREASSAEVSAALRRASLATLSLMSR